MAEMTEADIVATTAGYKNESKMARFDRMQQNKINYDMYHLRQDFSYKQKGQSRDFLPKMSNAVEQNTSFIQQGLVDIGNWFKVDPEEGLNPDAMEVKPDEIYKLLMRQLEKNKIVAFIADAVKLGMIGSLMIVKVYGRQVPKYKYKYNEELDEKNGKLMKQLIKVEDKCWELRLDLVRQEDYYPDPRGTGSGSKPLYEMQDIYLDYYQVLDLAKQGLYDMEMVKTLKGQGSDEGYDQEYFKNRETGQNSASKHDRHRIKLTECWGNIINAEGELIHENVVWTVANDRLLIQKPTPNPLWHGESPFITAPIISVPHGVWGRALMDAPAMLNRAINEMFNLMVDGGIMSVHGIKQISTHLLEDATQVENGIAPGDTLRANVSCPPGMPVLQRVDTSSVPQDGLAVMNLLNQEFFSSALSSDLRSGLEPVRQVKATQIVEQSQAISGMFAGMAKTLEQEFVTPMLKKSWQTVAQHMSELDFESMKAILGSRRAQALAGLSNEKLFADTVSGCQFTVFGISALLAKQKNFTKLQGMLQTIASSPVLMEEFSKKYDFAKLLTEIMEALDIRSAKLEKDMAPEQAAPTPAMNTPQGMPNAQSQIPQAGAAGNQGDLSPIPTPDFPGSRANEAMTPIPGGGK